MAVVTGESWLADAAVGVDAFDADGVLRAGDVEALVVDVTATGTGESVLAEALDVAARDAASPAVQARVPRALQLLQHLHTAKNISIRIDSHNNHK